MRYTLFIKSKTCQFISNVVNNVGIVESSSLILPPTLDENARLSLKVRQMKVVSMNSNDNLTIFNGNVDCKIGVLLLFNYSQANLFKLNKSVYLMFSAFH